MGFISDAVGDITDFVGGITGTKQAGEAAAKAGKLQYQATQAGIEENRRQFDKLVELMSPYVTAGTGAMQGQQALTGLQGGPAQQQAINALMRGPEFQGLVQQGENALLQNASATGGLRGGNTQAALAQFRPQMLSALINQQYGRLGGLSQLGQASATGQAAQGMNLGTNIANLLQQGAQGQGLSAVALGNIQKSAFGDALGLFGNFAGMGGLGGIKKLFS